MNRKAVLPWLILLFEVGVIVGVLLEWAVTR